MSTENTNYATLAISQETHRQLKRLADEEHRSLIKQVAYMVERRLRELNIDPDSLRPLAALSAD